MDRLHIYAYSVILFGAHLSGSVGWCEPDAALLW